MFRSKKEALRSLGLEEVPSGKKGKKTAVAKRGRKSEESAAKSVKPKSPKKGKQMYPVGTALSKLFTDDSGEERAFDGEIVKYDAKNELYLVRYEDGDEEEMEQKEVDKYLKKKGDDGKKKGKVNGSVKAASGNAKAANGKANGKKASSPKKAAAAPKFGIGSNVSKELRDEAFNMTRPFNGSVTGYDSKSMVYTVTYENDSSEKLNEDEVAEIFVPRYKFGTQIKADKAGMIGKFDMGKMKYHVSWGLKTEWLAEQELEERLSGAATNGKAKAAKKSKSMDTTDEEDSSSGDSPQEKPSTSGRRRATKKVNYKMDESSDEVDSSEDEKPKAKKAKKAPAKKPKGKAKKGDSDSEDDFAPGVESEDDELMDDAVPSEDDDEEEEFVAKKKPSKKASAKKSTKSTTDGDVEKKTKMSDVDGIRKTLKNNPDYFKLSRQEIKDTQSFLDPCGMEATDDIIDRLVGHQLDRISKLLSLALQGDALGSKKNPLVLGTACSGTDAPALALMLNQEQLEARGMGGLFHYEHVFSCEKEPYKQAYLARK